ncbi:DedA family protein [Corynebacterium tapiri]|uniref:DedA family protein n=1 Tax=Corynebacterium tapiri TaxID=1448266 RepID=A0A5C4U674_9CORY|nr:VTT domain-containing protein [Corynebacterium tapiri]TNL98744.1 DedA family protein [Corynebacterium tapiri]
MLSSLGLSGLLDAGTLLQSFGSWILAGLGLVIFIESGVLFPFLPGDSLLVTAAILRGELGVSVWQILLVAGIAAIAGDQVGFWLGRRFGRKLFKPNARILKTRHLEEAETFFHRWGPLALVLGRFVPIVRTYVPLAAGTAAMNYRSFLMWNVLGALGWVVSMTMVGVLLGHIPGIAHRIDAIMLVVVGISVLPIIISAANKYFKSRGAAQQA